MVGRKTGQPHLGGMLCTSTQSGEPPYTRPVRMVVWKGAGGFALSRINFWIASQW